MGRQTASDAQLFEGKRGWRMESIANAAMRRGGSDLRDAFIEALVESKCMSTSALRHAAAVSNFEGSLDAVSSMENSLMEQQLATEQAHVQSRALLLNKEVSLQM